MALLNISAAARATGRDRKTLHRKINEGVLSPTVGQDGARMLDTAELVRVFGPLVGTGEVRQAAPPMPQEAPQQTTGVAQGDSALVEVLRDQLRQAAERERRLWEQLEATVRLLPPPRQPDMPAKAPPQAPEKPATGFSAWWLALVPILAAGVGYGLVRWGG